MTRVLLVPLPGPTLVLMPAAVDLLVELAVQDVLGQGSDGSFFIYLAQGTEQGYVDFVHNGQILFSERVVFVEDGGLVDDLRPERQEVCKPAPDQQLAVEIHVPLKHCGSVAFLAGEPQWTEATFPFLKEGLQVTGKAGPESEAFDLAPHR